MRTISFDVILLVAICKGHSAIYFIFFYFTVLAAPASDNHVARQNFEDGTSKILVCTSVGEEGLDFTASNLVIMYNYVTGEVGRIQRKGDYKTK